MKKLGFIALIAAASLMTVGNAEAKKGASNGGGLEISGNAVVLSGVQIDNNKPTANTVYSFVNDSDRSLAGHGQLGDFRGAFNGKKRTFNFYADAVELDIARQLGDNIRVRADLDLGRFESGSITTFSLEQGYVTANIPVGPGLELAMGRFNLPIGLESNDRIDNVALSFSNSYRFANPHSGTGAKLYIPFNDNVDLHVFVVNNLFDVITRVGTTDTAVPSAGARLGFNWGPEGRQHTLGVAGYWGPEGIANRAGPISSNRHYTFGGVIDAMFHFNEKFSLGLEGFYRQDNIGGACTPNGSLENIGKNCKGYGAQAIANYVPNDKWDVYLRYDYMHDIQGNLTGVDQQLHAGSLGAGYQLTDGAKIKAEYRIDFGMPSAFEKVSGRPINHGFALMFGYRF